MYNNRLKEVILCYVGHTHVLQDYYLYPSVFTCGKYIYVSIK